LDESETATLLVSYAKQNPRTNENEEENDEEAPPGQQEDRSVAVTVTMSGSIGSTDPLPSLTTQVDLISLRTESTMEQYDACTFLFIDIFGTTKVVRYFILFPEQSPTYVFSPLALEDFEAWAAHKDSAVVFSFLTTVFQTFDEARLKYNVCKMEAVGNSYGVVTGLLLPQTDHAERMSRYAFDCQAKMKEMCEKMVSCFGNDVTALTLKMGMHSGPCQAAVLRSGGVARFKVCGDAVNIATLMEETCHKGGIQISCSTAEYLAAHGKDYWYNCNIDSGIDYSNESYWLVKPEALSEQGPSGLDIEFAKSDVDLLEDITQHFIEQTPADQLVEKIVRILSRRKQCSEATVMTEHHNAVNEDTSIDGESNSTSHEESVKMTN
jgi:Adenylate and Guanylate cyclase catalytic domain